MKNYDVVRDRHYVVGTRTIKTYNVTRTMLYVYILYIARTTLLV